MEATTWAKRRQGDTFGRFARERAASYGGKPGTLDFLEFKHVCGTDAKGKFAVIRIPSEKSCRKFLATTSAWLKRHRHWRRRDQQRHLARQLKGFSQSCALHRGGPKLKRVEPHVEKQWRHAIKRQSQRSYVFWSSLRSRSWCVLPHPKVLHPGFGHRHATSVSWEARCVMWPSELCGARVAQARDGSPHDC